MFNTYRLEMGTARCGTARAADRSIEAKRRHLKGAREEKGTNDRDTERTKGGSWSKGVGGRGEGRAGEKGHSRELRAIHVTLKYFGKFMPNKN